jgi:tRNA 2-thiouridine synthesizing protein A
MIPSSPHHQISVTSTPSARLFKTLTSAAYLCCDEWNLALTEPEDRGADRKLDARGLHCPLPILRTRALLDKMLPGETLAVEATDPASVIDFKHFCNTTDHEMLDHRVEDGVFYYRIRCGGGE